MGKDLRLGRGEGVVEGLAFSVGEGQVGGFILKVHKIENFFGSEFEFYTISLLVMLKY